MRRNLQLFNAINSTTNARPPNTILVHLKIECRLPDGSVREFKYKLHLIIIVIIITANVEI